jgi:hypothetical protein
MKQTDTMTKTRAEELRVQRATHTDRQTAPGPQRTFETTMRAGTATLRGGTPVRRATAPTPTRPVIVRNVASGMPARRQVPAANPRRAYYLSMNTPATEMRLPALPVIHMSWRMLSATIALMAGIGLFSLVFSPFFQVGAVSINGLERLTQSEVEAVLDLENLSVIEVTPRTIEEELLTRFTSLESASISVSLPTNIALTVKERTPVLAWKQGDTYQWIDAQGVLFQPNGDAGELVIIHSSEPAPVVLPEAPATASDTSADDADLTASESGVKLAKPANSGPVYLEKDLFATARKLAERLPAGTPLVYTLSEGLGWEDVTGYDVFIGADLASFDQKFNMVQSIAEQLTQKGVVPELINADDLDAPYYRAEN